MVLCGGVSFFFFLFFFFLFLVFCVWVVCCCLCGWCNVFFFSFFFFFLLSNISEQRQNPRQHTRNPEGIPFRQRKKGGAEVDQKGRLLPQQNRQDPTDATEEGDDSTSIEKEIFFLISRGCPFLPPILRSLSPNPASVH